MNLFFFYRFKFRATNVMGQFTDSDYSDPIKTLGKILQFSLFLVFLFYVYPCVASVHTDIHVCLCVGANVYAGEHAFVLICEACEGWKLMSCLFPSLSTLFIVKGPLDEFRAFRFCQQQLSCYLQGSCVGMTGHHHAH